MNTKIFMLLTVLTSAFICGCSSVAQPVPVKDVKVLSQRVKIAIPEDWQRLKETIGSTHTVYYSMANPNPEAEKNNGTIFMKFQNCDTKLNLDMYREYVLRKDDFSENSGNTVLKESKNECWYYLKWQGNAKDKTFVIWDIIGVIDDVAGHIRATCPANDQSKELQKTMDRQLETVFKSIEVTPKDNTDSAEKNNPAESQSELTK